MEDGESKCECETAQSESRQKLLLVSRPSISAPPVHQEFDILTTSSKMMVLLKTSVALLLFVFGLQIALSATLISSSQSNNNAADSDHNELDGDEYQTQGSSFQPKIGVYVKNYAGRPITVVGENNNSDHLVLSLPVLKAEDYIWEGKSITLECWSNETPVYFEYRGLGAPKVRVTTERKAPNFYNTSSYTYGAIVTFTATHYRQTGEYSCHPVNSHVHSQSVFIFSPGKRLFVTNSDDDDVGNDRNGKVIKVMAESDSSWVTIPCAPSDRKATVQIYSVQGQTLKQLSLGDSLDYDPLEGFRLKWKGIGSMRQPWGNYLCTANNSKISEEKLWLKLRGPSSGNTINRFSSINHQPTNSVPKVSLNYNSSSRQIECCSTSKSTIRGKRQMQKTVPTMRLTPCVSISDCYFSSGFTHSSSSSLGSDSFIKQINDTCVAYELPEIYEAGLLHCSVPEENNNKKNGNGNTKKDAMMQFSYEPELGLMTNFDSEDVTTNEIMGIGREVDGSSKEVTYFCTTNSFFFSTGIKWAIERRSGKPLEFLNEADSRPTLKVDEKQVSKVFCFAPIYNSSTEWRNVSMNVADRSR